MSSGSNLKKDDKICQIDIHQFRRNGRNIDRIHVKTKNPPNINSPQSSFSRERSETDQRKLSYNDPGSLESSSSIDNFIEVNQNVSFENSLTTVSSSRNLSSCISADIDGNESLFETMANIESSSRNGTCELDKNLKASTTLSSQLPEVNQDVSFENSLTAVSSSRNLSNCISTDIDGNESLFETMANIESSSGNGTCESNKNLKANTTLSFQLPENRTYNLNNKEPTENDESSFRSLLTFQESESRSLGNMESSEKCFRLNASSSNLSGNKNDLSNYKELCKEASEKYNSIISTTKSDHFRRNFSATKSLTKISKNVVPSIKLANVKECTTVSKIIPKKAVGQNARVSVMSFERKSDKNSDKRSQELLNHPESQNNVHRNGESNLTNCIPGNQQNSLNDIAKFHSQIITSGNITARSTLRRSQRIIERSINFLRDRKMHLGNDNLPHTKKDLFEWKLKENSKHKTKGVGRNTRKDLCIAKQISQPQFRRENDLQEKKVDNFMDTGENHKKVEVKLSDMKKRTHENICSASPVSSKSSAFFIPLSTNNEGLKSILQNKEDDSLQVCQAKLVDFSRKVNFDSEFGFRVSLKDRVEKLKSNFENLSDEYVNEVKDLTKDVETNKYMRSPINEKEVKFPKINLNYSIERYFTSSRKRLRDYHSPPKSNMLESVSRDSSPENLVGKAKERSTQRNSKRFRGISIEPKTETSSIENSTLLLGNRNKSSELRRSQRIRERKPKYLGIE